MDEAKKADKAEKNGNAGTLGALNAALRSNAQALASEWMLDNLLRINSALGLAGFTATFIASGMGSKGVRGNPYRAAIMPVGLSAMAIGLAFQDKRLTKEDIEARKALPFDEHMRQSLSEAFDPIHHPFRTNGLLGLTISGLLLASYRYERNSAFWGELSGALAAAVASSAMLVARDPAESWQIRSASYLLSTPPESLANWQLANAPQADSRFKGRWMLTKTALAGSAHVLGYLLGGAPKNQKMPESEVSGVERTGRIDEVGAPTAAQSI